MFPFARRAAKPPSKPIGMPVRASLLIPKALTIMRAVGIRSAKEVGNGLEITFSDFGLESPSESLRAGVLGDMTGEEVILSALSESVKDPLMRARDPVLVCGTGLVDGDRLLHSDGGPPPDRPRVIVEWATRTWSHYGHVDMTMRAIRCGGVDALMRGLSIGDEGIPRISAARQKHEMFGIRFEVFCGSLTPSALPLRSRPFGTS